VVSLGRAGFAGDCPLRSLECVDIEEGGKQRVRTILMMRAPRSAIIMVAWGPARARVRSTTVVPFNGPDMLNEPFKSA
jgi:hypothetical protein